MHWYLCGCFCFCVCVFFVSYTLVFALVFACISVYEFKYVPVCACASLYFYVCLCISVCVLIFLTSCDTIIDCCVLRAEGQGASPDVATNMGLLKLTNLPLRNNITMTGIQYAQATVIVVGEGSLAVVVGCH